MKSSIAWSIGSGQRSTEWKSGSYYTPGPGAYDPHDFKAINPPSWRVGTASRDELYRSEKTPGPGSYESTKKITKNPPQYTMGMKTGIDYKEITPGPGAYEAPFFKGTERRPPSYTMRVKTDYSITERTPGPGAYDQSSRVLNKTQPSFRIGTAQRDELYRSEKTPGPGTYTTRPNSAYNSHSGPKFPFGTAKRDDPLDQLSKTLPGPGSYNFHTDFESPGKGVTMISRRPDSAHLEKSRMPGPGAYYPNLLDKSRAPTVRIGTASRNTLSTERIRVPGPGNYDPDAPKSHRSIRIGTSLRKALSEATLTPGPGTYELRSKETGPKHVMASRKEDVTKEKNDRTIPGPGTYTPSVDYVRKKQPKIGIGSGLRDDLYKIYGGPGPGAYDIRKGFIGPKWGFGSAPRTDRGKPSTEPGPGTYTIRSSIGDVPKYAFGSNPLKITY